MRAIVRFSLDSDSGSKVRNVIAGHLESDGFERVGTGCWEAGDIDITTFCSTMRQFWKIASNPQTVPGASARTQVDHVWVYADHPGV